MATNIRFMQGCRIDGERTLASGAADYVAGMAAKITATGLDVALTPATVDGIFKNDKSVDASAKVGPMAGDTPDQSALNASVAKGNFQVELTRGKLLAGTYAYPFASPPTGGGGLWTVGDKMYVNGSGKWDNAAAAGGDPSFGTVVEVVGTAATPDAIVADLVPHYFKG